MKLKILWDAFREAWCIPPDVVETLLKGNVKMSKHTQ